MEGPREWSENGREEGVLDEKEFFFSDEYRSRLSKEFPFVDEQLDNSIEILLDYLEKINVDIDPLDLHQVKLSIMLAHDLAKAHERPKLSLTYFPLGLFFRAKNNFKKSLFWFEKSRKQLEKFDLEKGLIPVFLYTAENYSDLGKKNLAEQIYIKALKISEKFKQKKYSSHIYMKLGVLRDDQGDLNEALELYQNALKIIEELNIDLGRVRIYNLLGGINKKLGNYPEAMDWAKQAIDIGLKKSLKVPLSNSYNTIGAICEDLNQYDQAYHLVYKS